MKTPCSLVVALVCYVDFPLTSVIRFVLVRVSITLRGEKKHFSARFIQEPMDVENGTGKTDKYSKHHTYD